MKRYQKIFLIVCASLLVIAMLIIGLIFLMVIDPHIPSFSELRFRSKLNGQLESPEHIAQLTDFKWDKVCVSDDFNTTTDHLAYILIFFSESEKIQTFYLDSVEYSHFKSHIGSCFLPTQKLFHEVEKFTDL